MSYKIKFDDITSVQVESQKTMNAWEEAIANLNKAMSDFINNQNLQGQAISSMRNYLVEVHGTLLQTLVNLMNDYSTNLLLYKDGYYQIDSSNHAKLPGQVFTRLHSDLKSSRDNLKSEIEFLNTTKDKISDLVSYSGSSHTSTVMNYNFLMNQVKNLDNSIIQYESNHASQDLVAFKELLSATKALIAEHAGKTRTVGTYQSGDFAKLQSVQRFAMAYKQATQQMESRVERVEAAQERDKARFEALAAEDRAKNGWKDLALGVVTVAFSILAIVGSMGFATPLVVGAGLTAGLGSFAYGASNAAEGIHNIQLGNAGDAHTKSYNLIRDTLFMGNDKLYHDVGNVFVTASAIMIPIGQTQSVVKGLTQFAIGEAGAYTAGQVAYHGTKLLGGSEEDAQTANFIGNIVGGYAVSSAASKFSLNKVKVDVEAPKYNKEQILKKDLRPYTGDLMDPIEAKRYSDYWRSKGMGSEETWQDFKKNIPNGTIDDYNKILYEQDPWPLNVKPSFKILKGGDTFEMAMAPRSKQLDTWPGNFATDINTISDSQYVRDRLAVKYNWKPDIDRVVQYRVKEGSEIPANVGPIGPQIDLEINRYLPGGPNQIEMLMGREKMNFLEIIGIRNIE